MKYLIISADDYGLDKKLNEGVIEAREKGIVTTICLMPAGDAFDNAVGRLGELGPVDVAAHLALTEVVPVTDPRRIPTLVASDGRLHHGYAAFFTRMFLGKVDLDEAYLELRNQLERLARAGVAITCLNSHHHIHMMPSILNIFVRLAREYDIPAVRCLGGEPFKGPFGSTKICKSLFLCIFAERMKRALDEAGIPHPDSLIGFLDAGRLSEDFLISRLNSLPDGCAELVCHPGFLNPNASEKRGSCFDRERELRALTSGRVKESIEKLGVKLIPYRELLALKP